jgi:hypothetical protein
MSPFWASLFQYLRHCGRDATLFIVALIGIGGLCVLAAIIQANGLQEYLIYVWPPVVIAVLIWACVAIRRMRARRRERLHRQPLSADELRAALSKLRGNKNLHRC